MAVAQMQRTDCSACATDMRVGCRRSCGRVLHLRGRRDARACCLARADRSAPCAPVALVCRHMTTAILRAGQLQTEFARYASADQPEFIQALGIEQFCRDLQVQCCCSAGHCHQSAFAQELLQVEPEDIVMLTVSWHFAAKAMGEYSREEFVSGMQVVSLAVSSAAAAYLTLTSESCLQSLNCFSVAALRQKLPELRTEIADPVTFRVSVLVCTQQTARQAPELSCAGPCSKSTSMRTDGAEKRGRRYCSWTRRSGCGSSSSQLSRGRCQTPGAACCCSAGAASCLST